MHKRSNIHLGHNAQILKGYNNSCYTWHTFSLGAVTTHTQKNEVTKKQISTKFKICNFSKKRKATYEIPFEVV